MENYLPMPQTLENYAEKAIDALFRNLFLETMRNQTPPAVLKDKKDHFWITTKISDHYLTPLFENFFDSMKQSRNLMDKSKFYQLVDYSDIDLLDREILEKINLIEKHFCIEKSDN